MEASKSHLVGNRYRKQFESPAPGKTMLSFPLSCPEQHLPQRQESLGKIAFQVFQLSFQHVQPAFAFISR